MKKLYFIIILICCLLQQVQAQDALTNSGNLQIFSGASVTFFGDFTNNGTYIDGGGTVHFNGSIPQNISSSVNTTFNDFIVDNISSTGVTIVSGTVTIGNSITFVNGLMNTSASNLLIINDNATSSGASGTSYVEGPVEKIGNDAFTFPVGKTGVYQPISISAPSSITDAYTAEYFIANPQTTFGTAYDAGVHNISGIEYWNLNRTLGTSNVYVTIGWNSASGSVTNLPDMEVAAWDGLIWNNLGNGGTTGSVSSGTVSSFSTSTGAGAITLASNTGLNPLPVTLLAFTAALNHSWVDLAWQTASEINNDYFSLEKSIDGKSFETFANVKGAGNSNSILKYADIDNNPYHGISYYRLKQTDFNGKFSYSNVVPIRWVTDDLSGTDVYPNPTEGDINIRLSGISGSEFVLCLTDLYGRICYSRSIISQQDNCIYTIPATLHLTPGMYMLSTKTSNSEVNNKIIVR